MPSLKDMIERGKGPGYVPLSIREAGGLALSLWKTGANRTDCLLVADLEQRQREAVAVIERAATLAEWTLRDRRESDKVAAYAQEMILLTERRGSSPGSDLTKEADHG